MSTKKAVKKVVKKKSSKETKNKSNPLLSVPSQYVADFFGVTQVALHYWVKREDFPKDAVLKYGHYNLPLMFNWWVDWKHSQDSVLDRKKRAAMEKLEQEAKIKREEFQIKEMQRKRDAESLVPVDEVIADTSAIISQLAADLENAKKRLPAKMANKSEKELMKIAEDEIDTMRNRMHKNLMAMFGKVKKGE